MKYLFNYESEVLPPVYGTEVTYWFNDEELMYDEAEEKWYVPGSFIAVPGEGYWLLGEWFNAVSAVPSDVETAVTVTLDEKEYYFTGRTFTCDDERFNGGFAATAMTNEEGGMVFPDGMMMVIMDGKGNIIKEEMAIIKIDKREEEVVLESGVTVWEKHCGEKKMFSDGDELVEESGEWVLKRGFDMVFPGVGDYVVDTDTEEGGRVSGTPIVYHPDQTRSFPYKDRTLTGYTFEGLDDIFPSTQMIRLIAWWNGMDYVFTGITTNNMYITSYAYFNVSERFVSNGRDTAMKPVPGVVNMKFADSVIFNPCGIKICGGDDGVAAYITSRGYVFDVKKMLELQAKWGYNTGISLLIPGDIVESISYVSPEPTNGNTFFFTYVAALDRWEIQFENLLGTDWTDVDTTILAIFKKSALENGTGKIDSMSYAVPFH